MNSLEVGFDVGGTFIDVVTWDGQRLVCYKTSSARPDKLANTVVKALEEALSASSSLDIGSLLHGTTAATNTLIERRGASVALITTKGFRDVLEIGRMTRRDHFNVFVKKVAPLVERSLRLEVDERVDAGGESIRSPAKEEVRVLADQVRGKVDAIAISFINSYLNPDHERQVAEWIEEFLPSVSVSISSDVTGDYGEYERTSTVVVNEYLRPGVRKYLETLEKDSEERIIEPGALRVIQSNGGVVPARTAARFPVRLLESGPAAGVSGCVQVARQTGMSEIISFDMGGTSTDVSVVAGGRVAYRNETEVEGFPIRAVMSDIRSIGAGGGSLIRVDETGSLYVGPESAGADPGPMCYGAAGESPTVTDADLVCGYLNPSRFCGGEKRLYPSLALEGIAAAADQLSVSPTDAALGALRVAITNMAGAVRKIATEHGRDVRDMVLVAFGGAGPVHATFVAEELEMVSVLIPPLPGLLSALGLLVADVRADAWRTFPRLLREVPSGELGSLYKQLEQEAASLLGEDSGQLQFIRRAEMCYRGQRHEIGIDIPAGQIDDHSIDLMEKDLQEKFVARYRFMPQTPQPQIVTLRVFAIGRRGHNVVTGRVKDEPKRHLPDANDRRTVYYPSHPKGLTTPIFDRAHLRAGDLISGPAIIEEDFSTSVVAPGRKLEVLSSGDLLVRIN